MFIPFQPNPLNNQIDDCTVRAICAVIGLDWEQAYMELCMQGLIMCRMPDSKEVWGAYLKAKNFSRHIIPDTCPDCYTVIDFCYDNPKGVYVLATNSHVIGIISGNYMDSWDSGRETPVFYWKKGGLDEL